MMTYVVGLPLLILAALLQSTVLPHLRLFGGTLDLLLLLTLGWTLSGDWTGGLAWGFIGGVCADLLSGAPFGFTALALVLMAYFASLTEGRFWRSHVLLPLATIALGTLGFHFIYLVGLSVTGRAVDPGFSLFSVVLPAAVLNTVFMLPVYHALRWLHNAVYPPQVEI
jgi:rod shape-determining protein MreD